MDEIMMWAIFAALIAVVVIAVFMVKKGKFKTDEMDYRAYFFIGLTWIPLGLTLKMPAFWGLGLLFMAVGLINYKKWGQPVKLKKKQQKFMFYAIAGLLSFLAFALIVMFLLG